MSCMIYSDYNMLEVLPIAFSTTLSSSVSVMHASNAEWFEAWNPSQDSLSITVRMQNPDAQMNAIWVLQKWAQENAMLRIVYPERNFDWRCTIESCPLSLDYSVVMKDFTVTFFLLTNSFLTAQQTYQYSDVANALFTNDYIREDIYDSIGTVTDINDSSIRDMYDARQSFSGYDVSYTTWPYVTITAKRWAYIYTLVFTKDLANILASGQDVLMYCEQNYRRRDEHNETDLNKGVIPKPRG